MQQIIVRHSKAVFWTVFLAFVALAAVPSVVMIDSVRQYYRFLSAWNPGTLQSSHTRSILHHGSPVADVAPQIHFVEFQIRAPKAKNVLLFGDFSRWDAIPMHKAQKGGGLWEIQLPLPAGKYQYLFQVDGAWTKDPAAASGKRGDLITSLREVAPSK